MGKSWKERPNKWRHQLSKKKNKGQKWQKPKQSEDSSEKKYSPFSDSQEYHESFI